MANVIAILNEDGEQILDTVVSLSVSVSPTKTFAKHTLENGQVVTDDQFDNPTQLSMQIILEPSDYDQVYKEIKTYYEAVTNFTIQTRVDTYTNMFIESLPHDETPDMQNTVSMTLEFTEQLITDSSTETLTTDDVANSSDASTTDAGEKNTTEDDGTVLQSLASSTTTYLGGRT